MKGIAGFLTIVSVLLLIFRQDGIALVVACVAGLCWLIDIRIYFTKED